jgi:hypothetical protein
MADITPDINTQQYGPSSVDTGGNIPQTTTDAPNPDYTQYNKDVPAIQAEGQGTAPQGQPAPQAQPQAPQPQQPNQAPEGLRPVTSPVPTEQHPSVQRAGWVHDVAETLSGGPRYKYDVDPNTGEMKKTPVPVSGKHLALAIALEALQGSLTGLAAGRGKGPGAAGAAAMAQQQAQQQKIKEQAQREASDNYARGAAIAETNMRMIRNEQISAQADSELQQKDVDRMAPVMKDLQDGGHIKQLGITDAQAKAMLADKKLNITSDMLIPYAVAEEKDASGNPVKTIHGVPKFQKLYALADPLADVTLPPEILQKAYDYKLTGFVNPNTGEPLPLSPDLQLRAHQVVGVAEKIRSYELTQAAVDGQDAGNVHTLHSGTNPANATIEAPTGATLIKDPALADINDKAATSHDLNPAILAAVAQQESSGNTKVADSKPNKEGVYAVGPYQVTPGTAKQFTNPDTGKPYTETEIRDPKTNATVAAQYLSNLIKSNAGDVHKALVMYHGAPADVLGVTGEAYANQVMAKIPQGATPIAAPTEPAPKIPSLQDAVNKGLILSKDIDTLNGKLFGAATLLDGQMSVKDIAAMAEKQKADPDSVGRLMSWLGPKIDWANKQYEERQLSIKGGAAVQKAEDIQQGKDKAQLALDKQAAGFLEPPTNFTFDPNIMNMTMPQAKAALQAKGVQIPDNFSDLYQTAHYKSDSADLTPRVYKGVSGVLGMNRTMGKTYIDNFLNDNYQEGNYKIRNEFLNTLRPTGTGSGPGATIYNGGVAGQHLDLAERLFKNMNNKQSPVWNEAANVFGKKILGQAAPAVYDTVATQLANESSKVTTGSSTITDTAVEHIRENLKNSMSPEQARENLEALMYLMQPRFSAIANDAKGWDATNEYRRYVDPNLVKVYAKHDIPFPGYGKLFYSPSADQVWESQTGDKKDAKLLQ